MTHRLITFDLDHTLWNPDAALQQAEAASYRWLASAVPAFGERYSADGFIALRMQLRDEKPALKHQVSEIRRVAFREALQACGISEAHAQALAEQAFDEFWQRRQQVDIFPETPPLLATLAQQYTLGALSNGNACLKTIGLDHHFAFHYAGENFPAAKPAPDMFLAALQTAGVNAADSVHIGDHPTDDMLGARAVGMKTLWVNLTNAHWPHDWQPDAAVRQLGDIPAALAALR